MDYNGEIDAALARGESLKEQWKRLAAEFKEAVADYEATYLASEEQPTSPPELERPTTSSRTRKCPRGIGAVQAVL